MASNPSPAAVKPSSGEVKIDQSKLKDDVRRLIFDHCGTTPWDQLLNSQLPTSGSGFTRSASSPGSGGGKHVSIRDEVSVAQDDLVLLDIPVGLGLLFFAAQAEKRTKSTPQLTRLLLMIATPPPPEDPCHRLYVKHREQQSKRQASLDSLTQSLQAVEMKECTFKPVVSELASKLPSKGPAFFEKCKEWKLHAAQKLAKKAEREREEKFEEEMTPWTMNKKSAKIIKELRQGSSSQQREDSNESGGGGGDGGGDGGNDTTTEGGAKKNVSSGSPHHQRGKHHHHSPSHYRREPQKAEQYSFEPITNTASRREVYLTGGTRSMGRASPKDDEEDHDGDEAEERVRAEGPAQTTASHIVQRLQEDIKAREVRAAERKKKYEALQKERLYDPETGQPLFQPNALPTKKVGKKRIAFKELPPEEQQELKKRLERLGMDYVTYNSHMNRVNKPKREIQEIVSAMADRSKKAETHIQKIRRDEEKEQGEWFKPKLAESSVKMTQGRQPLHEHELPKKPPPPEPPKKHVSSAAKINEMLERTEQWKSSKEKRLHTVAERVEQHMLSPCTFQPNRAPPGAADARQRSTSASTASALVNEDELVAAAEVRMRNELEMLRRHPAYQDPQLLQGARSASLRAPSEYEAGRHGGSVYSGFRHEAAEVLERKPLSSQVRSGTISRSMQADVINSPAPQNPAAATTTAPAVVATAPPLDFSACRRGDAPNSIPTDPMKMLDDGVDELEALLTSWKSLDQETDGLLDRLLPKA